jgi:hypothetical protein
VPSAPNFSGLRKIGVFQHPSATRECYVCEALHQWSPRCHIGEHGASCLTRGRIEIRRWRENGAGDRSRTDDFDLGKVALYQLSYTRPVKDLIL